MVVAANERHRDPGLFYVVARLAPGKTHAEVEAVLLEELDRVAREGVTEEEVARAREQLTALEPTAGTVPLRSPRSSTKRSHSATGNSTPPIWIESAASRPTTCSAWRRRTWLRRHAR